MGFLLCHSVRYFSLSLLLELVDGNRQNSGISSSEPVVERVSEGLLGSSPEDNEDEVLEFSLIQRPWCCLSTTWRARSCCMALLRSRSLVDRDCSDPSFSSGTRIGIRLFLLGCGCLETLASIVFSSWCSSFGCLSCLESVDESRWIDSLESKGRGTTRSSCFLVVSDLSRTLGTWGSSARVWEMTSYWTHATSSGSWESEDLTIPSACDFPSTSSKSSGTCAPLEDMTFRWVVSAICTKVCSTLEKGGDSVEAEATWVVEMVTTGFDVCMDGSTAVTSGCLPSVSFMSSWICTSSRPTSSNCSFWPDPATSDPPQSHL